MKIDVDFEIFGILAFYSAILLGKMLLMSALTSRARIQKKVRETVVDEQVDGDNSAGGDGEGLCSTAAEAPASSEVLKIAFFLSFSSFL
jgi:hypothetical protein